MSVFLLFVCARAFSVHIHHSVRMYITCSHTVFDIGYGQWEDAKELLLIACVCESECLYWSPERCRALGMWSCCRQGSVGRFSSRKCFSCGSPTESGY